MTTHSSVFAWKIPWMEEPGRLRSMGSLRVRHDWVTSLSLFTFLHWRRKWQPTPVFLPGESQGGGAWWVAVYGVTQNQTRLKRLCSSSSSMHIYRTFLVAQTVKHLPEMPQRRTQLNDLTFFHFHNAGDLGSIPGLARSSGEGNGNPLQCSCLENPRDGGAWWAAVYGVAQSRTLLKWLSSSSSTRSNMKGLPEDMEYNIQLWKMLYWFGEKGSVYAMYIITKWNMIES